ncbi:ribosome associated membrane protein, putative [Plasmodium knowlesi strain H]|uniref:Ribosome associated membrane protein, putative n=3 Tax=Plasmodium knowlesi TaxID=5850 RepID=A0A5K1U643_PLAKH|nr:ribosome associated membrane protein RAMP4, putative [Plasmodium knowlesi strain H]OTN66676.1 putative Ribosome associated membrane protein [Plasmodium knowlesi]CAA9986658.1 ribosome associated membrane protein RAMP4, putative [Plasmodium knowlesi strain H]SBO23463.1 ribosome associated membrane protein, putative [Plasmodium knowlesi strain H]SBO24903.1 ribosome associated membrane protein, putative [Plasmodium knowlesi strain H]VVS76132.1 ribosome associated membrane protein RAMP4, putativ|eukprot:XP_002257844.1 ribosome associated membrane protein, putative [Plasmodium knowlesi strain H]
MDNLQDFVKNLKEKSLYKSFKKVHKKYKSRFLNKMASNRKISQKVDAFDNNITQRGNVPTSLVKKGKKHPVGPILLVIFIFVVIGSVFIQILSMIQKSKTFD